MKTLKIQTKRVSSPTTKAARHNGSSTKTQKGAFPRKETTLRSTFRYKIIRQLGDGGMGRAFLAYEYDSIDTFRPVALKMLHTPQDQELRETFILEAKLMRLMHHANILSVFGFEKGTSAFQRILSPFGVTDSYESFMIMEYVPGFNLEDLLRIHQLKGINFLPQVAAYITSRVARGLAYAHDFKYPGISAHGVIHRDVSPSNVLINQDGRIKLSDFGIAYPYDPKARNPQMCGTPTYIAPEVLAGEKPSAISDVYSVGLLLELMLLGRPRYTLPPHKTLAETIHLQLRRIPNHRFHPEAFRHVPQRLVEICRNATANRPEIRYQSANDLALDLELFLRNADCAIGPQQIDAYLDCVQSDHPRQYRSREFLMFDSGRETLNFKPFTG